MMRGYVEEDDSGGNGALALQMRDVVGLDADRSGGQTQQIRQLACSLEQDAENGGGSRKMEMRRGRETAVRFQ